MSGARATLIAVGPTGSDVSYDGGRSWTPFDTAAYDAVDCVPRHVLGERPGRRGRHARPLRPAHLRASGSAEREPRPDHEQAGIAGADPIPVELPQAFDLACGRGDRGTCRRGRRVRSTRATRREQRREQDRRPWRGCELEADPRDADSALRSAERRSAGASCGCPGSGGGGCGEPGPGLAGGGRRVERGRGQAWRDALVSVASSGSLPAGRDCR